MDLAGRRILVTGASSGIGRATARLLSQLGARLVLVGRESERLRETASLLEGDGHQVEPYDLNQVGGASEWIAGLAKTGGAFSGLVHSAGITDTMPFRYLNLGKLNAMMQVNLTAALAIIKGFRRKGSCEADSSVVLIAAAAALSGVRGLTAYTATKGALVSVVRPLALELAPERIRINCVAPGFIEDTGMASSMREHLPDSMANVRAAHPLGMGKSINVAHAVAFLLADTGSWISGTTLVVDGAYSAG